MFAVQVKPILGKYAIMGGIEDLDEAMVLREATGLFIEPVPAELSAWWDAIAILEMPQGEDMRFLVVLRDTKEYQQVVKDTIMSLCDKRRTSAAS